MKQLNDLWGSIPFESWKEVKCIKNTLATEDDVLAGRAVFHIDAENITIHKPIAMEIPSIVYQIDSDTGNIVFAIVIQAELVNEDELIGLRYFDGGNGICHLCELEIITHDSLGSK